MAARCGGHTGPGVAIGGTSKAQPGGKTVGHDAGVVVGISDLAVDGAKSVILGDEIVPEVHVVVKVSIDGDAAAVGVTS